MMIFPMRSCAAARGLSTSARTTEENLTGEVRVTKSSSRKGRFFLSPRSRACYSFRTIITSEANPLDGHRGGWIEIIAGGMFSGKSEELIRRLRRALLARQRVQVFKPVIDDRFSVDEVVSRDDRRLKATPVRTSAEMLARIEIGRASCRERV